MADTTTNLSWPIPVENSDPWYAAFLTLMNAADADVYANQQKDLDDIYNNGSSVTVDTAAVTLTVPDTSNNVALSIVQNDVTNNPAAIQITNTGTGSSISTVSNQDFIVAPNGSGKLVSLSDIVLANGKALQTNTTAADTLLLQAYDVDGTVYVTFATLTANNTPTMVLSGDVTSTTQSPADNSTKLATTAYVDAAVATADTFLELTDTPSGYTADGALYIANNSGGTIDESTVILTEAANTFALTKGTASLDIAAGATLNIDQNLSVTTACTLDQDLQQSASVVFANITLATGGALRTNTSAGNTLLLQAYDVDGAAYVTFATLTANNTPTMVLASAVTGTTQSPADNSTKLATTAYVDAAVATKDTFLELTDTPSGYTTDGALYIANNSGGTIDESTVILTEAANTFALTKGTASLDIAAGATLNVDQNLSVTAACTLDQDLQQSASPSFAAVTLSGNLTLTSGGSIVSTANGDITAAPNGTGNFVINGGLRVKSTTVASATYSTLKSDYLIKVTYTTTAAVTITLDTDTVVAGAVFVILDAGGNASGYNITVETEGSETISGQSSWTINDDYNSITLWSDGSNWFII